jgi:hypothetical protein
LKAGGDGGDPYTDKEGAQRNYFPDFVASAVTGSGERINLLIEITGMRRDKVEKKWTVENRWLPDGTIRRLTAEEAAHSTRSRRSQTSTISGGKNARTPRGILSGFS